MRDYREAIKHFLVGAKKLAILALGNKLRADDGAAILLAEELMNKIDADIFIAETAPESYALRLIDGRYTHVIIIDAAISDKYPPGAIFIVDKNSLSETTITTHSIPISLIIEILESNGISVLIVGIRPKTTMLSGEISKPVRDAINKLRDIFMKLLRKNKRSRATQQ